MSPIGNIRQSILYSATFVSTFIGRIFQKKKIIVFTQKKPAHTHTHKKKKRNVICKLHTATPYWYAVTQKHNY